MLGFESRFWPEELFDVVCTDSYLPEIWTLKPEGFRDQSGEPNYLITGFVAGDAADKVCERDNVGRQGRKSSVYQHTAAANCTEIVRAAGSRGVEVLRRSVKMKNRAVALH